MESWSVNKGRIGISGWDEGVGPRVRQRVPSRGVVAVIHRVGVGLGRVEESGTVACVRVGGTHATWPLGRAESRE
jgi:hypothetical protein